MVANEVLQIATTILLALGGGGAIVIGLSSWLGKVWADRLMQQERHRHDRELAEVASSLERRNASELEQLRISLDLAKTKLLDAHGEKVRLYQQVTEIIVDMVVDLTMGPVLAHDTDVSAPERIVAFERLRLRAYGYLAMFAPQGVMDAYDRVVEYLHGAMANEYTFDFVVFRERGLTMLNAIRVDLGVDPKPVEYGGDRY